MSLGTTSDNGSPPSQILTSTSSRLVMHRTEFLFKIPFHIINIGGHDEVTRGGWRQSYWVLRGSAESSLKYCACAVVIMMHVKLRIISESNESIHVRC